MNNNSLTRAEILSEALPYIRNFSKKTVVIKYGGAAMANEELKRCVISDIVLLSLASIRVVVVHGGGPEINTLLDKLGKEPRFIDGLRYTDEETMDVVQMVLAGKIGKDLAGLVAELGGKAVGLCGIDGSIFGAEQLSKYGLVGEIKNVDPTLVEVALDNGYIPIISTVAGGMGGAGGGRTQVYNINADTAAGALAAEMKAEKLILLTDVKGIMADPGDDDSLIQRLTLSEIPALVRDGVIKGGMIPKVDCCVEAIRRGVNRAHILDGRIPHSILVEMLTDTGIGTMIYGG